MNFKKVLRVAVERQNEMEHKVPVTGFPTKLAPPKKEKKVKGLESANVRAIMQKLEKEQQEPSIATPKALKPSQSAKKSSEPSTTTTQSSEPNSWKDDVDLTHLFTKHDRRVARVSDNQVPNMLELMKERQKLRRQQEDQEYKDRLQREEEERLRREEIREKESKEKNKEEEERKAKNKEEEDKKARLKRAEEEAKMRLKQSSSSCRESLLRTKLQEKKVKKRPHDDKKDLKQPIKKRPKIEMESSNGYRIPKKSATQPLSYTELLEVAKDKLSEVKPTLEVPVLEIPAKTKVKVEEKPLTQEEKDRLMRRQAKMLAQKLGKTADDFEDAKKVDSPDTAKNPSTKNKNAIKESKTVDSLKRKIDDNEKIEWRQLNKKEDSSKIRGDASKSGNVDIAAKGSNKHNNSIIKEESKAQTDLKNNSAFTSIKTKSNPSNPSQNPPPTTTTLSSKETKKLQETTKNPKLNPPSTATNGMQKEAETGKVSMQNQLIAQLIDQYEQLRKSGHIKEDLLDHVKRITQQKDSKANGGGNPKNALQLTNRSDKTSKNLSQSNTGLNSVSANKNIDKKVTSNKNTDLKITTNKNADLKIGTNKNADLKIGTNKNADLKIGTNKNADLKIGTNKSAELKVATSKNPYKQINGGISAWDRIYSQINQNGKEKRPLNRSIEDDVDDEYESADEEDEEMSDFIDDGPVDDAHQFDYSQHIKSIFKYDKNRYKEEEEDDLRNMESSFGQVQKEEFISGRIGRMEDLEDMRLEEEELKRKQLKAKSRK